MFTVKNCLSWKYASTQGRVINYLKLKYASTQGRIINYLILKYASTQARIINQFGNNYGRYSMLEFIGPRSRPSSLYHGKRLINFMVSSSSLPGVWKRALILSAVSLSALVNEKTLSRKIPLASTVWTNDPPASFTDSGVAVVARLGPWSSGSQIQVAPTHVWQMLCIIGKMMNAIFLHNMDVWCFRTGGETCKTLKIISGALLYCCQFCDKSASIACRGLENCRIQKRKFDQWAK